MQPTEVPRWRAFAIVVAFTLVLAFGFHPETLGIGGTWKLPGWDATRVFWADLVYMRRSVLAGEWPLWNPYDRAGYAFAAEPQSGLYDPITWIVVLFSIPLGHAPAWLISLKALLYYVLGATGVYAFVDQQARRRGVDMPPWAHALGIMVYVVGGRMDKLKDQSGLWPSAWAPWLLVALAWALRRPDWRRGVVLGLVGGLAVLSGYPPIPVRLVLLLLLPLGTFWLVERWLELEVDARRAYVVGLGTMLAVAVAVVVGLAAAQVLATAQVLPMTKRADLSTAQVLASQIELEHGLGLLAPGKAKVSTLLYAGVGCGLAVLAAVVFERDVMRWLLFAIGVVGFLLSCGENAPLLPLLAELPGFRSFRIAGHFVVLSAVASAVLVPFGAEALSRDDRNMKIIAPCLAVVGAAVFFRFAHEPTSLSKFAVAASVLIVGSSPWVVGRDPRAKLALGWALVALVGIDVFGGNRPVARILQPMPDETRPTALANAVVDPDARMADFSWARNRPGPRTGVRDLVGARPALTDRHYMTVYADAQQYLGTLRAMGVERAAFGGRASVKSRLKRDREAEGLAAAIREVPDPWPRAFFTTHVQLVEDAAAARRALRVGTPRAMAFGEDADALAPLAAGSTTMHERLALDARGHGRLSVDLGGTRGPGVVVFNEAWDPGWRATVDGVPADVLRVNLLHRAVVVPANAGVVTLSYRPPWIGALSWLWLLTLLGASVVTVDTLRRERSAPATPKTRAAPSSD